jgi:serine/threonine-protein kinase
MSELLDKTINGKYRIVRLIGKGGMGSVYEAVHEGLNARVALKALHSELAKSGLGPRFLQEARAAARIQSPHVVRVSDVDQTEDGLPYMVLELLDGRTLQALYEHLYKAGERLPYPDALEFAVQICEGVEAAHAAGIVHRDLKPDNVMITVGPKGQPLLKLLDFGIAKLDDKSDPRSVRTRPGVIMGTPEYMAPEQAFAADTADARADVFSLGVMIFEMIAGHRPVGGEEPHEIAVAYLTGNIPRLRDAAPSTPPEIDEVVAHAMAAKPTDRLGSVRALREVLEPFLLAVRPASTTRGASPSEVGGARPVPATNVYDAARSASGVKPPTDPQPPLASAAASGPPPPRLDEPTKQSALVGGSMSWAGGPMVPASPALTPGFGPPVSSGIPIIPPTAVPTSGQQFPYGPSLSLAPRPPEKSSGPAIVAAIAIVFLLAIGGTAVWAVYYFTDVFDDAPRKKKTAPKPAPKPTPPPPKRLK